MITLDVIASSLLYAVGLYGFTVGLTGMVMPEIAARLGAEMPGRAPYLSMATLGLFGFVGGAGLITTTFGAAPYTAEAIGILVASGAFAGLYWLTGLSPAILYRLLARVRLRFDRGRRQRRRYGLVEKLLNIKPRKETHDEKIQNTIGTAGILGVGVTIINAALAARLLGVEYESGGAVFAVVSGILVLTTIFAAGALQRFDAWK